MNSLKALTSLDYFYQELRKIPKLERDEEEELARRWQQDHDLASVQRLKAGICKLWQKSMEPAESPAR